MTSKDEQPASRGALAAFRERRDRHELIMDGLLPGLDELFEGSPFYAGSIQRDIQAWCDYAQGLPLWRTDEHGRVKKATAPSQLLSAIAILRDTCNLMAVEAVRLQLEALGHDDQWRMRVYQACMGGIEATEQLSLHIGRESLDRDGFEGLWREAVILGLLIMNPRKSMVAFCEMGLRCMRTNGDMYLDYRLAKDQVEREETSGTKVADDDAVAVEVAKIEAMVSGLKGRDPGGNVVAAKAMESTGDERPTALIVPQLPGKSGSASKKEMHQSWDGIAGQALPLVERGDIADHRRRLVEQWPHAADVIDVVLGDLAARETVRFKPTLMVGSKGSGKSSLARAICDTFRLPCELYSMAGASDSSLSGTSAQWSNSRESIPLQLIKRTKTASVGMIWDEIEKADPGLNNGSALDALLPMLEIDQARHFRDLALEVEVDLSWVSHFATANSTSNLSAPLRDRFRILHVPEPSWTHLGTLSRQIVDRIARQREIDPRWFSPMAEDELDLVRAAWPGGSLRKLTRIIETILDGRDQFLGRC